MIIKVFVNDRHNNKFTHKYDIFTIFVAFISIFPLLFFLFFLPPPPSISFTHSPPFCTFLFLYFDKFSNILTYQNMNITYAIHMLICELTQVADINFKAFNYKIKITLM